MCTVTDFKRYRPVATDIYHEFREYGTQEVDAAEGSATNGRGRFLIGGSATLNAIRQLRMWLNYDVRHI